MFEIRQVRELKARKAYLVSECGLERSLITAEAAVFEQKTRWTALVVSGAIALLPRLHFLLPVAGWILARSLGRRGRKSGREGTGVDFVGLARKGVLAWQLFKRGRALWAQWRGQRSLKRLKPVI